MEKIRKGEVKPGPTKLQMKLYIGIHPFPLSSTLSPSRCMLTPLSSLGFLKFRDITSNSLRFFYNTLYGRWVRSPKPYIRTELPINIPEVLFSPLLCISSLLSFFLSFFSLISLLISMQILDVLLKVHGYEIFINGAFNGDPQ